MSTFFDMLEESKRYFPLCISYVLPTVGTLTIGHAAGEPEVSIWHFNTTSPWRIVQGNGVICSADWKPESASLLLTGKSIHGIIHQSNSMVCEPAFIVEDQMRLEIFSMCNLDPWWMKLPNGSVFNGEVSK